MSKRPPCFKPLEPKHQPLKPLRDQTRYLNQRLFNAYSSSQNYFYSQKINDIVSSKRCQETVEFNSWHQSSDHSFLKRYYMFFEYHTKMVLLVEYYRYHQDVPRFFQHLTSSVIYKFYDRKRRINYNAVVKKLKGDNNGDMVDIHDSEATNESQTGISQNPSLLSMIPREFKYVDQKHRVAKNNYLKESKANNEDFSITLNDLNNVLATIIPSLDQSLKAVPLRSAFLKKDKGAERELQLEKTKILNKDINIKSLMVKQMNKEGFIEALTKNLKSKKQSNKDDYSCTMFNSTTKNTITSKKQTAVAEPRVPNLNINNLNININFNGESYSRPVRRNNNSNKCSNKETRVKDSKGTPSFNYLPLFSKHKAEQIYESNVHSQTIDLQLLKKTMKVCEEEVTDPKIYRSSKCNDRTFSRGDIGLTKISLKGGIRGLFSPPNIKPKSDLRNLIKVSRDKKVGPQVGSSSDIRASSKKMNYINESIKAYIQKTGLSSVTKEQVAMRSLQKNNIEGQLKENHGSQTTANNNLLRRDRPTLMKHATMKNDKRYESVTRQFTMNNLNLFSKKASSNESRVHNPIETSMKKNLKEKTLGLNLGVLERRVKRKHQRFGSDLFPSRDIKGVFRKNNF